MYFGGGKSLNPEFILKPKFYFLIVMDFDFLDIFIESKQGVLSYLHLCIKVNKRKCGHLLKLKKCKYVAVYACWIWEVAGITSY